MAITVCGNCVDFGTYSLQVDANGICTDGVFSHKGITCFNHLQGSVSGYTSGGDAGPPGNNDVIDKFPFASDSNATDVGDIFTGRYTATGNSSSTDGYSSGGAPGNNTNIDKFPFASDTDASFIANLIEGRSNLGGTGQSSTTSGYASGGACTNPSPPNTDTIDKFPFSSDANATDVGELTCRRLNTVGQSSPSNGYASGGYSSPPPNSRLDIIDKFPFSVDAPATDIGELTSQRGGASAQSSEVSGYTAGGNNPAQTPQDTLDKFPFAADASATDVSELACCIRRAVGQSALASGYFTGGQAPGDPNPGCRISKFPFASDTTSTAIANLTVSRQNATGQQV